MKRGYRRAVNRGLASVNTPFVLTISLDAKINLKALNNMYAVGKEDDTVVCVAPGLYTQGQGLELWVMEPGELRCIKADFEIGGHFCTWFTSGTVASYRTEALKEIGGFDENIFVYNEDCELSYRLTQSGYSLIILPDFKAHHINSDSTRRSVRLNWRKDWNYAWSILYLLKKHKGLNFARKEAISLVLERAPKANFYFCTLNVQRLTRNCATFMGAVNFLIGKNPHRENKRREKIISSLNIAVIIIS